MTKSYDASSIYVYKGLDGVRKTPTVYVNETNDNGIFKIFCEAVDNSCDEAVEGHGKRIAVVYDSGFIWVIDEGRGLPIDIHKDTGLTGLETILTTLNAGGKSETDGKGYKKATFGIFGMGVSVTNALSSELQAWSYRKDRWNTQTFKKGKPVTKLEKCKAPAIPYLTKWNKKAGTIIRFKPDISIFDEGSKLDLNRVKDYLDKAAYLNKGLTFVYASKKGEKVYYQPRGIVAYLESIIKKEELETWSKVFTLESDSVHLTMQWSKTDTEYMNSLVNSGTVKEGGTHIQGFNKALSEAVAPYGTKKTSYKVEDLKAGLVTVLNVNVKNPKFSSQVKDKLITPEATAMVYEATAESLKEFFAKNKTFAKELIKRAVDLAKINEQATMDKKAKASFKSKKTKNGIPAKLSPCRVKDRTKAELFLVEGDSAAGTAVKARDSMYHAILRLRGKVLNVYGTKGTASKIFNNEEIKSLLATLGYNADKPKDFKFNYGKIIVMADEDPDGDHISTLVLSCLHKLIPQAFDQGLVYILKGSLFTCEFKGKRIFADTRDDILKMTGGKLTREGITRIKGWGEAQPAWLDELAFNNKTRKLIKIIPSSSESTKKYITLVGSGPAGIEARCEIMGIEANG